MAETGENRKENLQSFFFEGRKDRTLSVAGDKSKRKKILNDFSRNRKSENKENRRLSLDFPICVPL